MKRKFIISCRHYLIKRVMSNYTDWLRGTNRWMDGLIYNMCTPAVRAILFKLLTHALQAPMRVSVTRVNVTSERIPTHPGIKVKSGN